MTEVVVDTSVLINLLASRSLLVGPEDAASVQKRKQRQMREAGYRLVVPAIVAEELRYVMEDDPDDAEKTVKKSIDLNDYCDSEILSLLSTLGADENVRFVDLSIELDDGEAACLAVAQTRGLVLATDDRKGRRIANELDVPLLGTAKLIRTWVEANEVEAVDIRRMILDVQQLGSWQPRNSDPDANWWSLNSQS